MVEYLFHAKITNSTLIYPRKMWKLLLRTGESYFKTKLLRILIKIQHGNPRLTEFITESNQYSPVRIEDMCVCKYNS